VDTSLLLVSSSSTVLVRDAHAASSHLRDIDLRISQLTNPVELGIRKDLALQPGDLDVLHSRLDLPLRKSTEWMGKLEKAVGDLDAMWKGRSRVTLVQGQSRAETMSLIQTAVGTAAKGLAQVPQILDALHGPGPVGPEAVRLLQAFRQNVGRLSDLEVLATPARSSK
jgi:hypothetical protein